MEEMIARWIGETRREYEKAKLNQNVFKMLQMSDLEEALKDMRDRL
jgi:hypothetical protein